jgi:hypothetical protein
MPNTVNTNQQNPEEGGSYDTWGDILDANRQIVDKAFGSTAAISVAGGTHELTQDQSNHAVLRFTGALASNQTVATLAGKSRFWIVRNETSGAYSLTIENAAGGDAVTVAQGKTAIVFTDGNDCFALNIGSLDGLLDEDDMASNRADAAPSQQSVAAFVNGKIPGRITISTDQPTGGSDGDIHFRVLP